MLANHVIEQSGGQHRIADPGGRDEQEIHEGSGRLGRAGRVIVGARRLAKPGVPGAPAAPTGADKCIASFYTPSIPTFGCPVLETHAAHRRLRRAARDSRGRGRRRSKARNDLTLDPEELAAIKSRVRLRLRPRGPGGAALVMAFDLRLPPTLVHTGYELFLLLEGTKKLAAMSEFGSDRHYDEELFDRYVAEGRLHKEVHVERIRPAHRTPSGVLIEGVREIFYTPKGEEWRIAAWHLVFEAGAIRALERHARASARLAVRLHAGAERLVARAETHARSVGRRLNLLRRHANELAGIETAGYRALPLLDTDRLALTSLHERPDAERVSRLWDRAEAVAVICVARQHAIHDRARRSSRRRSSSKSGLRASGRQAPRPSIATSWIRSRSMRGVSPYLGVIASPRVRKGRPEDRLREA